MNTPLTMTRRAALRQTAAGVAALAVASAAVARARSPQPNIVFFLADDLGYADVACYGRRDIATPNIDRIAAEGMKFVQAYANSAVCSASRTAIITGRYQYRLPVGLEEPIANASNVGLPPDHPTLPSLLRGVGYGTTLLGKWHLGSLPKYGPLASGYDHFFGFRGGSLDYYTHTGGSHEADLWDGDTPIEEVGYLTDLIGDRAEEAVHAYAGAARPFFLDVHFNAPHWPWEAPGDQAEAERLRTAPLVHYDGGSLDTYRRMIARMDLQVGRVLKALDETGLADNTIVVFTSDNGGERFADTWPFTGRKEELLEGGLRIPAVVRWPARIEPGQVTEQVTISMDWAPTLLAAAGTAPRADYPSDGVDLMPIFSGTTKPYPRTLCWRYKGNHQRAIRDGDWKVLKILDNTFLFDVVADPMERANLKGLRPEVYNRLIAEWDEWNKGMLPEVRESFTQSNAGNEWADHVGAAPTTSEPDLDPSWPSPRQRKK
jgi:arylsulfatase A-like enzyme